MSPLRFLRGVGEPASDLRAREENASAPPSSPRPDASPSNGKRVKLTRGRRGASHDVGCGCCARRGRWRERRGRRGTVLDAVGLRWRRTRTGTRVGRTSWLRGTRQLVGGWERERREGVPGPGDECLRWSSWCGRDGLSSEGVGPLDEGNARGEVERAPGASIIESSILADTERGGEREGGRGGDATFRFQTRFNLLSATPRFTGRSSSPFHLDDPCRGRPKRQHRPTPQRSN